MEMTYYLILLLVHILGCCQFFENMINADGIDTNCFCLVNSWAAFFWSKHLEFCLKTYPFSILSVCYSNVGNPGLWAPGE